MLLLLLDMEILREIQIVNFSLIDLSCLWELDFFSYIIGNIKIVIVQDDSISELKELYEQDINLWLIKLNKSNQIKVMNSEYFSSSFTFLMNLWDKDLSKFKNDQMYTQLKPRLQKQIADMIFSNTYELFKYFFKELDLGFKRELVFNMKFETFSRFKPYHERYKDDRHSFPTHLKNIILPSGHIPKKVYFIARGEAYASNSSGRFIYFKLPIGAYFGASHLLAGVACSYSLCYEEQKGVS